MAPRKPPEPAICGEPAEDGQRCNLPKGHDPRVLKHTFIAPPRTPEPEVEAVVDEEVLRQEVDELNATPPTAVEMAQQVFGDDIVIYARPVIAALARIMADMPELKAGTAHGGGRNAHFGYDFIKDTQVSGAIRGRLAREGVMIIPDVVEESWVETKTKSGATSWVTKLKIRFTAIHAESGDEVSGHGFGYGDDAGDKGANKAFTAALKYWLMKLLMGGGEDTENDDNADKRASERAGSTPAVTEVKVESAKIEGVARGGMSDKMTMTQKKQIFALYKDLDLTPEGFSSRIDTILGDNLVIPEDGDATAALNAYVNALGADDAGKLITGLIDEKDTKAADANEEAAALDEADEPTAGYG